MRKIMMGFITTGLLTFISQFVWAGNCEINFDRTACPGQEAISYKKCDGEKTCTEYKETATAAECGAAATAACENKRLNITKSKVITATFDGKPLKTAAGSSDFCTAYALKDQEFNHCDK